jgi:hypothetical protein
MLRFAFYQYSKIIMLIFAPRLFTIPNIGEQKWRMKHNLPGNSLGIR